MGAAAVLFDSGGVVLHPLGDRWNPRLDFEEVLGRHHPDRRLDVQAVAAGDAFLHAGPADRPRRDYHRHVLGALGITMPSDALLDDLEAPLPFDRVVAVYPDARPALDALRAHGIRMAVVSDAGPELERAYDELGLSHYFEAFAISAVVGVTKPDPRMFETARSALGLPAHDCLFVDDDPDLVAAAIDLVYQAVFLDRTDDGAAEGVPKIRSLDELAALVVG